MKKGFTLAELLMVMVVVGILVAVALPKYQLAVERGRALEGVSNICWASQYQAIQQDLGNTVSTEDIMGNTDLKWNYFTRESSSIKACRNNGWDYCIQGSSSGNATCTGTDCSKLGLQGNSSGNLCKYDSTSY